ncbi:DUF397 domain-containing protein [Streptomyces corynorhini]|uniref:DUF397 domain-containing protein n=1 Tax=Streptomyces corynorhini TaxID=2282652 RepID=A0A370BA46_9ACTN|nr:DUF397 domain-containing protein [Streptomyces corynorhini]RDG38668.1 DUF397 domain-containing protein [Streptomyces corynorhini]
MKHPDVVTAFKKASASGASPTTDCVEVAHTADGGRAVRDSKNPTGGTQFYPPAEWAAFLHGLKSGDLGR